ncbi:MAG: hypothetical protein K8F30_11925, partial [Taibaiella sp.]|nr:hypothetical protein [Taibaiella sp.]
MISTVSTSENIPVPPSMEPRGNHRLQPGLQPHMFFQLGVAKQAPKGLSSQHFYNRKYGAGDGIRTHDPNLGKGAFAV